MSPEISQLLAGQALLTAAHKSSTRDDFLRLTAHADEPGLRKEDWASTRSYFSSKPQQCVWYSNNTGQHRARGALLLLRAAVQPPEW